MPKAKAYKLDTVDLDGVDIAAAGVTVWGQGSPEEGDTYTVEDLARIAADSNAVAADLRPPVKLGHDRKQRLLRASGLWGEQPRTGTLKNFRVEGTKLLCDIKDMPKKLADLVPSAFRVRSMEIGPARSQREGGQTYDSVVKGLALLGATTPAFQTLDDIHAMYAGEEHADTAKLLFQDERVDDEDAVFTTYAVGDVIWNDEGAVMDIMQDISKTINPTPPGGEACCERYWVRDLSKDASQALVGEYGNGAAWVVPLTYDAAGEPLLPPADEWTLAEQAWVQASPDAPEAAVTDSGDGAFQNGEERDTTSNVKVKLTVGEEEREVELPDLDANQIGFFSELYGLEGDDVTPERVYAEMAARAETPAPPNPAPTPPAPPTDPPTPTGRQMSESEYAELRERADRGERAFEQLRTDRRDTYLSSLVRDGRLDPATIVDWQKDYDENEAGTRRLLDRLPVQEEFLRVYGGDDDMLGRPSGMDEEAYRAYCANQGIAYIGGAS